MTEQWFLDLDGVRSGPYQTSEVMSLIAEGEVLPHHQISSELKSEHWMTLLEWRLNHSSPAVVTPPVIPEPPAPAPDPAPIPSPSPLAEKPPSAPFSPPPSPIPDPIKPRAEASGSSTLKRDPMAEMFDMLQTTKHKREAKSQHAHAQAHAQHKPVPLSDTSGPSGTSIFKTIIAAALITVIGFTLGQLFKKEPAKEATREVVKTPPPAEKSQSSPSVPQNTVTENQAPPPDQPPTIRTQEVMDRSTEKMTIRTLPSATPAPTEAAKDMEDLKDLKKELMELKALKEEIKNGADSESMMNNGALMETYSDDPQGLKKDPQEANPETKGESDIHY